MVKMLDEEALQRFIFLMQKQVAAAWSMGKNTLLTFVEKKPFVFRNQRHRYFHDVAVNNG